jgi:hypothetical protein
MDPGERPRLNALAGFPAAARSRQLARRYEISVATRRGGAARTELLTSRTSCARPTRSASASAVRRRLTSSRARGRVLPVIAAGQRSSEATVGRARPLRLGAHRCVREGVGMEMLSTAPHGTFSEEAHGCGIVLAASDDASRVVSDGAPRAADHLEPAGPAVTRGRRTFSRLRVDLRDLFVRLLIYSDPALRREQSSARSGRRGQRRRRLGLAIASWRWRWAATSGSRPPPSAAAASS